MTPRCHHASILPEHRSQLECADLSPRPTLDTQAHSYITAPRSRASTAPRPPSARDDALIQRYLRVRGTRLARTTAQEYRGDLTQFAGSIGRHSLLTATSDDVAAWFHDHTRDDNDPADPRRWSVRTAHRRRDTLLGFYRWALRERLVRRNPVEPVELPRFYRRAPRLVSLADIEQIFTYAESRIAATNTPSAALLVLDVAVFRLMERLALRVSEAAGIRLSRLSTVEGELRAWIAKKGNKPNAYPITGIVADAFTRWLELRSSLTPVPGHEDFVFIHPLFGRRISRYQVWSQLRILAKSAGLDMLVRQALSPHKLRHARARAMLARLGGLEHRRRPKRSRSRLHPHHPDLCRRCRAHATRYPPRPKC